MPSSKSSAGLPARGGSATSAFGGKGNPASWLPAAAATSSQYQAADLEVIQAVSRCIANMRMVYVLTEVSPGHHSLKRVRLWKGRT